MDQADFSSRRSTLVSPRCYYDVLPYGEGQGSILLRLLDHLPNGYTRRILYRPWHSSKLHFADCIDNILRRVCDHHVDQYLHFLAHPPS